MRISPPKLILILGTIAVAAGAGDAWAKKSAIPPPSTEATRKEYNAFKRAVEKLETAKEELKDSRRDLRRADDEKERKEAQKDVSADKRAVAKAEKALAKAAEKYYKAEHQFQQQSGRPFDPSAYQDAQDILDPGNHGQTEQAHEGAAAGPESQPALDERGIPQVGSGQLVSDDTAFKGDAAREVAGLPKGSPGGGRPWAGASETSSRGGSEESFLGGEEAPPEAVAANFAAVRSGDSDGGGFGSAGAVDPAKMAGGAPILLRGRGGERGGAAGPATESLRAGEALLGAGNYLGALHEAEKAIAFDPLDPRGFLLKSRALSRMGDHRNALKASQEAVRLAPRDSRAHQELAWNLLHLGRLEEAIAAASRAIELDGTNAAAYAIRAFAYEQLGDREKMLADLAEAARLDPAKYGEHYRLALAGVDIFDPGAKDSWKLLEGHAPAGSPKPGAPLALGGLLLALAAAGAAFAWRKRSLGAVRPAAGPVSAGPELAENGLLAGKYRMTRVIGRGGMGQVWEARDESLGRVVAIKKMTLDGQLGTQGRALFLKEAQTLAALRHPNILDIFEIIDRPEGIYLVFEFLAGKTVAQLLVERKRLGLGELRAILSPVGAALDFAHGRRIIHRDLKPSNIMMAEGVVKVMDFGIARSIGAELVPAGMAEGGSGIGGDRTRSVAGTPEYMAPEASQGHVSAALDIYSLGVCAYEMAVGERPFAAGRGAGGEFVAASQRAPGLPPEFDALLRDCLAPDPRRRPGSVGEFIARLERLPGARQ